MNSNTNNNGFSPNYPAKYANQGNSNQNTSFPDDNKFFTTAEMNYFLSDFDGIIKHMDNGMPFINYDIAKKAFESVVGNNYNIEILSHEFLKEFDTYMIHLRITVHKNDKSMFKDVIGCEKCVYKKDNTMLNFDNLPKSAVKDGFKKFLSDYIGIGSSQYGRAKKAYEDKNKRHSYQNNNQSIKTSTVTQNDAEASQFTCSDCSVAIDKSVHYYSTNIHPQKRALCKGCQSKYR